MKEVIIPLQMARDEVPTDAEELLLMIVFYLEIGPIKTHCLHTYNNSIRTMIQGQ